MRVLFRLTIAMLGSALFACKPLPTLALMHPTGPIQPLRMVTGCHGELLASMDSATGDDVHLLPSGDMLLSGNAQTGFLLRLSPDGRVRWSLRTCSTPQVAVAGDDAIYASADAFLGASEPSSESVVDFATAFDPTASRPRSFVSTASAAPSGHMTLPISPVLWHWQRANG